jgi:pyruvate,water dikinase
MTRGAGAVALSDAGDARAYGGKAAQLAVAARAGLPVPVGVALPCPFVEAVTGGDPAALSQLAVAAAPLGAPLAVRSSAVGEDSDAASFAGQHATVLNVPAAALAAAIHAVSQSVRSEAALAYRRRLGITGKAEAGVVIQEMVDADAAGVLFCPHPVTGADEVVIEAAWGLGGAVVDGLVSPDLFRVSVEGEVLERRRGVKQLELVPLAGGGTAERPAGADRARALCLDDDQLARLHRLATSCRRVFGGSQDIEWAFAAGGLWLLQRRAVTHARRG